MPENLLVAAAAPCRTQLAGHRHDSSEATSSALLVSWFPKTNYSSLRSRAARAIFVTIMLAAVLGAEPAQAQQRKTAARAHAREGTRLFEAGRYREAINSFLKAYDAQPHFLVQCNIARCYELLNELRPAIEHYRRCLSEGGDKSPQAAQVRDALAGVEKRLAGQQRQPSEPATAPSPPPPPPSPPPTPPPSGPSEERGRPFWAVIGFGAGIEIKDLPSQLKVRMAFGYHFLRGLAGPNLGIDLALGVAGGFTLVEVGPIFSWDIPLAPRFGLYAAPTIGFGLSHLTTVCVKGQGCAARTGLDLQLGGELKLVIANRALLAFRPLAFDIVTTSGAAWLASLRYDLLMSGGIVF